jgi:hypothetical protein
MKLKEGFVLRTICGENVISGEGTANINFSKLISLNDTAAFLYRKAQGIEFTAETLAGFLTDEYEVDDATALKDAQKLCEQWVNAGIVEE